ncbi:hypothetical protein C0992_006659 [Termitomyces sp. T32_za158]|nr:hypothetical protein C0992_006659 [Termitomyces sp. T32_za158]
MQDMSTDALDSETLSKLTVPQLKAICKEKKISAYSKLQKAAIIQKILDYARAGQTASKLPDVSQDAPRRPSSGTTGVFTGLVAHSDISRATSQKHPSIQVSMIAQKDSGESVNDTTATLHPTCTLLTAPLATPGSLSTNSLERPALKRKAEAVPPNDCNLEKKNIFAVNSSYISGESAGLSTSSVLSSLHTVDSLSLPVQSVAVAHPSALAISTALDTTLPRPTSPLNSCFGTAEKKETIKNRKRFVPLVIKKVESSLQQDATLRSSALSVLNVSTCIYDLDFDDPPLLQLLPVTMPPSLSQRRHVLRLSLAFCFVSPRDLKSLAQCSRLFRYAVYISAAQRLIRDFSGCRLTSVMKQYSPNTTNMWPYLRAREKECVTRQNTFRTSFLGKAFAGKYSILHRLWASPDNTKQATIAARQVILSPPAIITYNFRNRFLLTRLFFKVSIGLALETDFTISDVQEVVEGEIWSIQAHSFRGKQVMYVLEATCEVIGHPEVRMEGENAPQKTIYLRADWSAYVHQHLTRSRGTCLPLLMEHLKWANYEEYYRGISKLWLSKIEAEGKIGAAKRVVAERYVLACVVSNSVSGRWMSSTEMAQESNGFPSGIHRQSRGNTILQLFLPAHHHVESVHFTSSDRKSLHCAVAVVQTPAREYFILKDNGMQIGCEEDGVADVWMELLQCDAGGRAR